MPRIDKGAYGAADIPADPDRVSRRIGGGIDGAQPCARALRPTFRALGVFSYDKRGFNKWFT